MKIHNFEPFIVNKRIIVKEKLQYPKILAKKTERGLTFCKKHGKRISIIDRTISSIYEHPIKFLNNYRKSNLDNGNYYFYHLYDNTSIKNNLLLFKYDNNTNYYYSIKNSDEFGVLQPIYDGIIDKKIYERLNDYSINDLVKLLNPDYTSVLSEIYDLEFLIIDNNKIIKTYNFIDNVEIRETSDITSVVLTDILNFFENYPIDTLDYFKTDETDRNYLFLIQTMYNLYNKNVLLERNKFLNHKIYDLNKTFLFDRKIENPELYKFMLNIFNRNKIYNSYFITEDDIKLIKKIRELIYKNI